MKNFSIRKNVLKTLVIASILFSSFSCEKDDTVTNEQTEESTDDNGNNNDGTKAAFTTIGSMDGDWDIDIAQRGIIEISGGGAYFENCEWVYALPLVTTIVECKYPNGFCQTTYVSGTTTPSTGGGTGSGVAILQNVLLPGGTTTTTSPGLISYNDPCGYYLVKINLPGGDNPTIESVMDQLKRDQVSIPEGETLESLASNILNTFSIPNDALLSDEVTEDIRKANPDVIFGHVTVLKASYPITYTDEQPNGYIHALVKISEEDSTDK